jgi:hypothetical protein
MHKSVFIAAIAAAFLAATSMAPSAAATKKEGAEKRTPSAAQVAARARQKRCAAEWRSAKAAGTVEKGVKWPQYWSACSKRLKK